MLEKSLPAQDEYPVSNNPPPIPLSAGDRRARALVAAAAFVTGAFLLFWPFQFSVTGTCAFQKLTGLPCGMCGGTRAVRMVLAGDWESVVQLNALAPWVAAVAVLGWLALLVEAASGRQLLRLPRGPMRVVLLLALTVGYGSWSLWHVQHAVRTHNRSLVNFSHPVVKVLAGSSGRLPDTAGGGISADNPPP